MSGIARTRLPVAAKTALATAGAIGGRTGFTEPAPFRAAVVERVAPGLVGDFVDEALDRKAFWPRSDRAPPHDRHMRVLEVEPDLQRVGPIGTVGEALDRRPLDPASEGAGDRADGGRKLEEIPSGKSLAGVAATPSVAAEMPNPPPKPAKRQKRGKSEKSTNAPKVDAAEAATNAPATPVEPPSDQGSGNPPPGTPTRGDFNARTWPSAICCRRCSAEWPQFSGSDAIR